MSKEKFKTFNVPVSYTVCGVVKVEADSIQQAMEIATSKEYEPDSVITMPHSYSVNKEAVQFLNI